MSELLKQLEGAAKELDTLVEMYVRNDSPTRAADCTAKAASVREAVALLSPSGAPAGLVEAADAAEEYLRLSVRCACVTAQHITCERCETLLRLQQALRAALSPAPQVPQETVQQDPERESWLLTAQRYLRVAEEAVDDARHSLRSAVTQEVRITFARLVEQHKMALHFWQAVIAALSAPPAAPLGSAAQKRMAALTTRCGKHPAYRAKRPPTANCGTCQRMWREHEEMQTLAAAPPPAQQKDGERQ